MIHFREVVEPHVRAGEPNNSRFWHIEYYAEASVFPVAMAYVVETIGKPAQLHFVFIADPWRGKGFGKEMILAAKITWPDLRWYEGWDPAWPNLSPPINLDVDYGDCGSV